MADLTSENNYNGLDSKLLAELTNIVQDYNPYNPIPDNNSLDKKDVRFHNTTKPSMTQKSSDKIKLAASISILKIACATFIKHLNSNHNGTINSEQDLDNFLTITTNDICNILHSIDPLLQAEIFDLTKPEMKILHQIITDKVIAHLQPIFNDLTAHLQIFEENLAKLNKVTSEDQDKKEVYFLLIASMKNGLAELNHTSKPDNSSRATPTHSR